MAKIIRFGNDSHQHTQQALPWYVTEQLDEEERAAMDAHLANCAACRRDLEVERELAAQFVSLPLNADVGWAAVRQRMDGQGKAGGLQKLGSALKDMLSRPTRLGWVMASQVLILVAAAGVAYIAMPRPSAAEYHALSAPPSYGSGNVIAMFRPDVPEQRLRSTLTAHDARIVDGPTPSGAYILRVPAGERAKILADLQQSKDLVLAQPIDAEPGP